MQPIAEKLSDEMRKKEYKYCVCEKKVVPLRRFSCARAHDLHDLSMNIKYKKE